MLARQILHRSKAYTIINNELYKHSTTGNFQRCVKPAEGCCLLEDIHKGECGHHTSSRAIASKAMRYGFYCPSALDDAE